MFLLCAMPFVTFALYAGLNAIIFHTWLVRRPILLMSVAFPPFLIAQSAVVFGMMRETPTTFAATLLAFAMTLLIVALLYLCYLQFYCLVEFSLSLRMLDHLLSSDKHALTYGELRRTYPLEEVVARKCRAASRLGILSVDKQADQTFLVLHPQGATALRVVAAIKTFCRWSEH